MVTADLRDLELLLEQADDVVTMREIANGNHSPGTIGLRHDVDNTFDACVELARWEAERGWRSTWFVLHDTDYWNDEAVLRPGLEEIVSLGHEVGLHTNAITVALMTGRDPAYVIDEAVARLRSWGHRVDGVVAHGDPLCYVAGFINDETFEECARPEMGAPDRTLAHRGISVTLQPQPLARWGFTYDAYRVGARSLYLSDSGGQWNEPILEMTDRFPLDDGQLHVLQHPCWWVDAFQLVSA